VIAWACGVVDFRDEETRGVITRDAGGREYVSAGGFLRDELPAWPSMVLPTGRKLRPPPLDCPAKQLVTKAP